MASSIFISYRRSDAQLVVDRMADRLRDTFGDDVIFRDIENIGVGRDFRIVTDQILQQSKLCLVVIGPSWIDTKDDDGHRRLDNPDDFVRVEIESAFRYSIPVVPVLIEGAVMPKAERLPESIRQLVYLNSRWVRRDPDFSSDMQRLITDIKSFMPLPVIAATSTTATKSSPLTLRGGQTPPIQTDSQDGRRNRGPLVGIIAAIIVVGLLAAIIVPKLSGSSILHPSTTRVSGVSSTAGNLSGTHQWVNRATSKCLEFAGNNATNGTDADEWDCSSGNSQYWQLKQQANKTYQIVNNFTHKCLGFVDNSATNGTLADEWDCTAGNSQSWQIRQQTDGTYQLQNTYTGKCLGFADNSSTNGTNADEWDCTAGNSQYWTFQ